MKIIKKIFIYIVLGALLITVLTVCCALSIMLLDFIFKTQITDIWGTSIRISLVTSIVLFGAEQHKKRKEKIEGEKKS